VPPAISTLDPFAALAEPRRRELLFTLSKGEQAVEEIVATLGWPQPQVSKHLGVLREVGLVAFEPRGRRRVYRINGDAIKTIHDWTAMFDKFWTHNLDRIKRHAEAKARERAAGQSKPHSHPPHKEPRP